MVGGCEVDCVSSWSNAFTLVTPGTRSRTDCTVGAQQRSGTWHSYRIEHRCHRCRATARQTRRWQSPCSACARTGKGTTATRRHGRRQTTHPVPDAGSSIPKRAWIHERDVGAIVSARNRIVAVHPVVRPVNRQAVRPRFEIHQYGNAHVQGQAHVS